MIIANIRDCERYYSIHKDFKAAFEALKKLTPDSEGCFNENNVSGGITIKEYKKGEEAHIFEAHKNYLDIHYIIDGAESFGYADTQALTVTKEYDEKEDYMLLEGQINKLYMNAGDFCIVFPEDAHIPCMKCETKTVKRTVVKILL